MSSIYGAWQLSGAPFSPTILVTVDAQTAWWHPDQKGIYHAKEVMLGHQLLCTLPNQAEEKQPCSDELAGLHIVADCRLDNRKTLQRQLALQAKAVPDYQLILASYQKWGIDCVQHFIGAFAFAIWDAKKQQFFCARDQMGIKPFNYYFEQQLFAFGTQKKSILAIPKVNRTADWRNLLNAAFAFPIPLFSTAYQHIKNLPPAHYLLVTKQGLQIQRYWELDINQKTIYKKDEDYVAHFQELFQQSISDRLCSNKGVGTHLSGGLDSSGITAYAQQISQQKGQAFSVFGYSVPKDFAITDQKEVEENLLAHDVVDFCKIQHFHNVYQPIYRDFPTRIKEVTHALDSITRLTTVDTEYELQAKAQAVGVNVLLSGFPGDELVTSFCKPYYLEYLERGQLFNYFFKEMKSSRGVSRKMQDLMGGVGMKVMPELLTKLMRPTLTKRFENRVYANEAKYINQDYFNANPALSGVLEKPIAPIPASFHTSLKAYQRAHINRANMAIRPEAEALAGLRFKVEYRYPLADIRLLQYVLSLPLEQKLSIDTTRYLFRRSMKGMIPESVRLRDVKTSGVLKTTHFYDRWSNRTKGKLPFWNDLKAAKATPFLNSELIDKIMNDHSKNPFGLFNVLAIGQLVLEGKLKV